ncbi:hypothetical protein [Streptococcus suis]|uniref:hypothetical protein n=1 Tax=Streptococcus suis TaxID=1307 RepID=UPI003BA1A009
MLSDEIFKISIPSDNDGFIIIKCSISNEKFMIQIEDLNDDSLIDIWCLCGGQSGDSSHLYS